MPLILLSLFLEVGIFSEVVDETTVAQLFRKWNPKFLIVFITAHSELCECRRPVCIMLCNCVTHHVQYVQVCVVFRVNFGHISLLLPMINRSPSRQFRSRFDDT
jgi:hypothetical protein